MIENSNDFGILREIWKKNKLLAKNGTYNVPVKSHPNVLLSDLLAIWPSGKNAHFLTREGIYRSPFTAKNMVEKLANYEYYWSLYYAINNVGGKKGQYLKPFIHKKLCLQPLSSLRLQPVWVNLCQLQDFLETPQGLYLFFSKDYYLLVDQSQRSFLHLLQTSGTYYWPCQFQCHQSFLPQEIMRKETSIFKHFLPSSTQDIFSWICFLLAGHRTWLTKTMKEAY